MSEAERPVRTIRTRPGLALAFAVAALASSWNPIAAPFGLIVAIGAGVIASRALRAGGRRRLSFAALGLSLMAFVVSAVVLVTTAGGLSTELTGERVVKGRSAADVERVLSEAAGRTRGERERAARELGSQPARPERRRPEQQR